MSSRQPPQHRPPVFDAITAGDEPMSFVDVSAAPQPSPPVQQRVSAPRKEAKAKKPALPSFVKVTVFWSVIAFVVLGVSEVSSSIVYGHLAGQSFSFGEATAARAQILEQSVAAAYATEAPPETGDTKLVVHPYLGYIQTPNDKWVTDDHGIFFGTKALITAADPKRVIVGVFGGSMAEQFSAQGAESLRAALTTSPRFAGKEIVIVPVAFAGYKQPQQLIAFNYLLSLGAHFDLIINIDGFNEVALSTAINGPKNVSPFFPSSWGTLVSSLPDTDALKLIGKTVNLKDLRRSWASVFQGKLGSLGVTPNAVWLAGDRLFASAIATSEEAFIAEESTPKASDALALGPTDPTETDQQVLVSLVESWKRSSLQMNEIASAKDIPYFHFLQPNQYVSGSKPMDEAEARTALNDGSPYKPWVIAGYPLLRAAGKDLEAAGVRFKDLTSVFAHTQAPLYADDCCHVNSTGYALLGTEIGRSIASAVGAVAAR